MARRGDGIYLRGRTWWLNFIHQGRRHQARLGSNIKRATAVDLAVIKRSAILKGEAGIGRKRRDISFEKAKEEFLAAAEANNRPNTVRSYQQGLDELEKTFAGKKLGDIHPFLIEKHKARRVSEDGAPVSFNRELGTLRTFINWCIDRGKFEGVNPTRKVKRVKESRGNERYLEQEEEDRLLKVCSAVLRAILMCGIYAGLRIPSEVLSLKWADIDLRRGWLTVQGAFAKSGKTETLPLNQKLRDALAGLKGTNKSEYVFTKADGQPFKTVQNIFRTACKRAGLSDISPHVMRHTFASRLGEQGTDIRTIQELGRWADIRMVQRYANVTERRKREAVERLSAENSTTLSTTPDLGKPVSLGSATGIRTLV